MHLLLIILFFPLYLVFWIFKGMLMLLRLSWKITCAILLFLLIICVILVPNTLKGDGTARGYLQVMLEYSTVRATIKGDVHSIKNPTSGSIIVEGRIGETIIDENRKAPADCTINELHAE